MTIKTDANLLEDWFAPVLVGDDSVEECLQRVIRSQSLRVQFTECLRRNLCFYKGRSTDSVTEIRRRAKELHNTLTFRLGMLSGERQGAWFRETPKVGASPFSSGILPEPVFNRYELGNVDRVQAALESSFKERKIFPIPFSEQGPSLWLTLLELNCGLEQVCALDKPFESLRFNSLPANLPEGLRSPLLEKFLHNVKTHVLHAQTEIAKCYEILWEGSCKLWDFQRAQLKRQAQQETYKERASHIRDELRKRRSTLPRFKKADYEALRFMQFEDLPTKAELKKRYIDLAKKWHPDLQGGNEEKFKLLSVSYAQLSKLVQN
ncbi:MAG: J domain-containing protein [Oligoflexales bacterium]